MDLLFGRGSGAEKNNLGEAPPLDNSLTGAALNVARNVGFVKAGQVIASSNKVTLNSGGRLEYTYMSLNSGFGLMLICPGRSHGI